MGIVTVHACNAYGRYDIIVRQIRIIEQLRVLHILHKVSETDLRNQRIKRLVKNEKDFWCQIMVEWPFQGLLVDEDTK